MNANKIARFLLDQIAQVIFLRVLKRCLKPESNRRPTHYECAALPTEPFRQNKKQEYRSEFLYFPSTILVAQKRLFFWKVRMEQKKFDVAVLGGGPGGYPAAIFLANAGKKVALIEEKLLGGTCLNWGCIPTKTLVSSISLLREMKNAEAFGIHVANIQPSLPEMIQKKNKIVSDLRTSLTGLIKASGVEIIAGKGTLVSSNKIEVNSSLSVEADNIILATGSEPKNIAAFSFDGKFIHSSTSILDMEKVPESLLIIGAGAIGCEFASIFSTLGTKITIVEALPRILPLECDAVSNAITKAFQKEGMNLITSTTVEKTTIQNGLVEVLLSNKQVLRVSCVLSAVGRNLNTEGFEKVGIRLDKRAVVVDEFLATSLPGVWAVGDITAKSLCAHLATHQGVTAAKNILGYNVKMHYDAIPGSTFTYPEIGSVGLTLEDAIKQGIQAKLYSFPLQALGRVHASRHNEGFAQMVVEEDTGRIVGAQVVGYMAGELVSTMALAIANEIPVECVAETIQAHPTVSESWLEVAMLACKTPLHFPKNMVKSLIK